MIKGIVILKNTLPEEDNLSEIGSVSFMILIKPLKKIIMWEKNIKAKKFELICFLMSFLRIIRETNYV